MKKTVIESQTIETAPALPKAGHRPKNKLYVLCIQSEDGKIERIFTGTDYEQLWLQGTIESKALGGFWSTYDVQGRFVDGNWKGNSK
jgi:hypothetical protein